MKYCYRLLITLGLIFSTPSIAADYNDWRKTGSDAEKINQMVKALPGTATHMLLVAERYRNLYWAGQQQKWAFAEYQLEEIEDLINNVAITRPKRKATAEQFLATAFSLFPDAIKKQDKALFNTAFQHLRAQCLICHARNDHGFITLPSKPGKSNSLVLETSE